MKNILLLSIASLAVFSCNTVQNTETIEAAEAVEVRIIDAYCTVDKLSVLDSPARNGKLLTSLFLGEKVTFLDSLATDDSQSSTVEYGYVQLSDGQSGWVRTDRLAIDKEVAVATDKLTIHSRPDMLNGTDNSFQAMDFLVVHEIEGAWSKVSGRTGDANTAKEGWVFSDKLAHDQEFITEALVFRKTLKETDETLKQETLNTLLENASYNDSPFLKIINEEASLGALMPEKYQNIFSTWFEYAEVYEEEDEEGAGTMVNGTSYSEFYGTLFSVASNMILSIDNEYPNRELEDWYGGYSFEWRRPDVRRLITDYSGIDPFLGDINEHSFSHINPKFVSWMSQNLVPDPEQDFLGTVNKEIYANLFANTVEWFAEGYLETHVRKDMGEELSYYYREVVMGFEDAIPILEQRYGNNSWVSGFWIRRELDGSAQHFFNGMIKFLKLYNPDYYSSHLDGIEYTSVESFERDPLLELVALHEWVKIDPQDKQPLGDEPYTLVSYEDGAFYYEGYEICNTVELYSYGCNEEGGDCFDLKYDGDGIIIIYETDNCTGTNEDRASYYKMTDAYMMY